MKALMLTLVLAAVPAGLDPRAALYPHAQRLVDHLVARNPGMIDAIIHVSPANGAKNIVVAAHLRKANGEASGDDDLGVMNTGAPLAEVQKDGARVGVVVQLRDAQRRPIGALGLMYRYSPGVDVEALIRRSFAIRDRLDRSIPSLSALVSG